MSIAKSHHAIYKRNHKTNDAESIPFSPRETQKAKSRSHFFIGLKFHAKSIQITSAIFGDRRCNGVRSHTLVPNAFCIFYIAYIHVCLMYTSPLVYTGLALMEQLYYVIIRLAIQTPRVQTYGACKFKITTQLCWDVCRSSRCVYRGDRGVLHNTVGKYTEEHILYIHGLYT